MKTVIGRKRALAAVLTVVIAVGMLTGCGDSKGKSSDRIRIGVTAYDQYDTFIKGYMGCFKDDIETDDGVTADIYFAAQNQQKQNEQVKKMIEDGCSVICVNLVDRTAPSEIIDMARKSDIPVIFFNRELVKEDLYRWDKMYYVGADAFKSGIMEGEIATTACMTDKSIDRNGDGKIQYVVLEGEVGHQDALVRTEYSVNTMTEKGLVLDKKGYAVANWNRAQAQTKMKSMIESMGNEIEVVLANNDDMALGAIDEYKAEGILRSDWPAFFGIDGTDDGLDAVKSDEMVGTVYNDKEGQAKAMYNLCIALAKGQSTDDLDMIDGKYIRLPYQKVTAANINTFSSRR